MTDPNTIQLVAAAAVMVGPMGDMEPGDWQAAMLDASLALHTMASEAGSVGKYLAGIAKVEDAVANKRPKEGKIFMATVKGGNVESSKGVQGAGRGVIVLTSYSTVKQQWVDENVRTDWLNNEDGIGERLFSLAGSLKGHKVKVWIELEPMTDGSGQSVRMLRHIEDKGFDAASAEITA